MPALSYRHPAGARRSRAGLPGSALASSSVPSGCQATGSTITCTYDYTGHNVRTLAIPAAVQTVSVVLHGAVGGGAEATRGGYGAEVTGTISIARVAAAEGGGWDRTLDVTVGGDGTGATNRTGGWPGGGTGAGGHYNGGGGAGWTGITLSNGTTLAIAGGGGGAGGYGSGHSPSQGGNAGQTGSSGTSGSGTTCFFHTPGGSGGGGASQTGAGGGGSGHGCSSGTSGGGGSGHSGGGGGGGNGAAGSGGGGGGGGAGWYGGGGGGGGGTDASGGAGGGGSSGVHGTTWITGVSYTGHSTTYAQVVIGWALQSSVTTLALTGTTGMTVPAGHPMTLRATVSGASSTPTGNVTFKNSLNQILCTSVGLSAGSAACTLHNPSALGSRSYTATYNGDQAYQASTSAGLSVTTVKDTTTVSTIGKTTSGGLHLKAKVTPPSYATT
ncbi:MAG TPA: Ig-like domain-containing protein, partial [Acidimicrobiales bacterium]|nr:Ig-like domain-containing protein [Acidimicrobiales bacterium]